MTVQRVASMLAVVVSLAAIRLAFPLHAAAAEREKPDIFRRENLIAWCIVPFDAKRRGPEERAEMLARLGFKHFAYDYRAEHVPTFDAEIAACKRHGVALDAWWFPGSLNAEARNILEVCRRHEIRPQLWVTGGGGPTNTPAERQARVEQEAARIRPIAEAAAAQGMKVGLYNHGGWFGDPENQLAIIEHLKLPNVGIVYNLHHGHDQVDRLGELLPKMLPHLLALNLNGMNRQGDRRGQKILQLGQGELDLALLRTIRDSGYHGPIGILGHTQDDAESRLQDNLDGLDWLLPQLLGKPAGPKPKPRTPVPQATTATSGAAAVPSAVGYVAAGRVEYGRPPLTVEVRATLRSKRSYNILVAADVKSSAAHWELFSTAGSGLFTAYLPGMQPDHVRTAVDVCDGRPHDLAMTYEAHRVRLYVDGRLAAEQAIAAKTATSTDTAGRGLAIGRLVEGSLSHDGTIELVRITRGAALANADADALLGSWRLGKPDAAELRDESKLANHAKRVAVQAAAPPAQPTPSPGVHLKPVDPNLKVVLLDRSPDQVYMGVKVDREGRVFVGGREGVFVFEPQTDGRYAPRRELLRFPQDSIIMGLEFRGDDLLVLAANALYVVPEGRVRREGLKPERLLWGLPLDLHVSFHCLAWGPEGDLYLTHGDPLLNYGDWSRPDHWGHWTLFSKAMAGSERAGERDWRKTPYTGQGAVLRYSPSDGAIHVVARGLRGPVGLAFDRRWNLFTNDNDHESRADQYAPAKLLHVARDGIDFGWPRGWMASKHPDRMELNEPVCDLGRGVPCDLTYYRDSHLPTSLRERLLMCRWDRHSVTSYQPVPRNDGSFSAAEETVLTGDENCRPVGIAVGRGGRLFVTALYMTGNMAAPYCASDLVMVTRADDAPPYAFAAEANARNVSGAKVAGAGPTPSSHASAEAKRQAEIVAVGERLTVPSPHFTPPAELPLFYPKESSFFKRNQYFYGAKEPVDLAALGRVGSFTTAEWWAAVKHTPEQEKLFASLVRALDDPADRVRLQAAYYLSLLKDARSEPLVERTRRDVLLRRLQAAPEAVVRKVWTVGPFDDADDAQLARPHGPEQGNLDLSASYGKRTWREAELAALHDGAADRANAASSGYVHFRVQSRVRQPALLSATHAGRAKLLVNGTAVADRVPLADAARHAWIVDLQPGGNDVLLRLQTAGDATPTASPTLALRAASAVEIALPEKLDSALLAARLREAAAAGSSATTVAAEFLSVDWTKAAIEGDAAEGRRLFGTLGCAKCHAVAPDQKSAGAPSLFEAKRRFTVPHLVESVLLPSRQVAEPFRAQSFTLDDGRTVTGLVVGESADAVELLPADATRQTIAKRQIEERAVTALSPMPQGLVKTPGELRHLLAYLLGDRPLPP